MRLTAARLEVAARSLKTIKHRYESRKNLFWRRPPPSQTQEQESQATADDTAREERLDVETSDHSNDSKLIHTILPGLPYGRDSLEDITRYNDFRPTAYTDTISTELDTNLGHWFVAKIELLFDIEHMLDPSAHEPLLSFVFRVGGDEYFLRRYVLSAYI
jgi:hypothetical protein